MHFGCCRFLSFESLQVRTGAEEQMSKNGPGEDQGPSLTSNENTQNQVESSTAATENTPEDQVRKHAFTYGGFTIGNHFCFNF